MNETEMKGKYSEVTREAEEEKLRQFIEIADAKINEMRGAVTKLKEDLHELKEVYDADEKEGLSQWFNTDARFSEVRQDLLRAQRARKKPFFGRIDIEDLENNRRETFYIGKTVIAKDPAHPEVIDWRAPIASVYYDHSLGKCKYKVPMVGYFELNLDRKRTFEIEDDKIRDFYDSDVVANDELLTKYLSKSKRNVLSEIIATIQDEQNRVIRRNPRHNMLIQGSAGSGKTTVAMHRISYILYNYETEFKPDGFYIIGSNKVLLNYITGVLPDLDVYGVCQMTMADLFTRLLYEDFDAKKMKVKQLDKKNTGTAIKSSGLWYSKLEKFADETELKHVPVEDIVLERNGHVLLPKETIYKELTSHPGWSMARKFERLNDLLTVGVENELFGRYYTYSVEEQKKIKFHFKNYFNKFIWKGNMQDLYEEFVIKQQSLCRGISYEKECPDIYDLASMAYLYKRIKETEVIQEASHVVIDEAQDFGIMIYYALNYCLSKCTFTIMGDVSQNINFENGLSDWEELKKVMLPNKYDYFGLLRKSYRNTVEVSDYAMDILRHADFPIYPVEPIIRHGDAVFEKVVNSTDALYKSVIEKLREYKDKGYETIALICKDRTEAGRVYEKIKDKTEAVLFTKETTDFDARVTVLPIELAKGLEFDAVVIFDASRDAYPKEGNYAKLLYVAATRALQELSVFGLKDLTGLISDPISENRKTATFDCDDFHVDPYEFEEEFKTKEQIAVETAAEGDKLLKEREVYGPKRIKPIMAEETKKEPLTHSKVSFDPPKERVRITSPGTVKSPIYTKGSGVQLKKAVRKTSEFGSMPDGTSIAPIGHGKIDTSVRWAKADKRKIELTSAYGTLRITPLSKETVRVMFYKGELDKVSAVPQEVTASDCKFTINENREAFEIRMEKLVVKVDKRFGAVSFYSINNSLLLKEQDQVTRQYHGNEDIWWEYLDFGKKEILSVRGASDSEWKEVGASAVYVSNGRGSDRTSLIMSDKGYQILVSDRTKLMLCRVPAYGTFLKFEDSECIDYIFRTAR